MLTLEIVTFAFPLFVRETVEELLLPRFTFPKPTVDGVAESCGCGWDCGVPVPLSATFTEELEALLRMETLPVRLLAVVGVNCMFSLLD